MHLGIMHFLSSIKFHLLKATEIALSKYERGNGVKNVNDFYFRKWNLLLRFSSGIKTLLIDPQVRFMLSKKRQS